MTNIDIQRAWRDGEYYLSLTDEQRAMIPNSPAGAIELANGEVSVVGGACTNTFQSWCFNSACTSKCSCFC
jgi:mersacidin/lichenicidin family type 2 lantibiotic